MNEFLLTKSKSPVASGPVERAVLEFDDWLADRLGKDSYRLLLDDSTRTDGLQQQISQYAGSNSFIQTRISSGSEELASALTALKFKRVETLVTFVAEKSTVSCPVIDGVRWARDQDLDQVVDLARTSFAYSRFHRDPNIPRAVADRIKADWVDGFFKGTRGVRMAVAEDDGYIYGFTLVAEDKKDLIIDLIAVSRKSRRKRLGSRMIGFVCHDASGVTDVLAGTQEDNEPSLKLYRSMAS